LSEPTWAIVPCSKASSAESAMAWTVVIPPQGGDRGKKQDNPLRTRRGKPSPCRIMAIMRSEFSST